LPWVSHASANIQPMTFSGDIFTVVGALAQCVVDTS